MRGTHVQEHALLESRPYEREALRELLRRMPTGVIVYEPVNGGEDFRIIYANPAMETAKPFRRMQGRTYAETWPEIAHIGLPRLRDVLRTGEPWVERGTPLEVEVSPGELGTRHSTRSRPPGGTSRGRTTRRTTASPRTPPSSSSAGTCGSS